MFSSAWRVCAMKSSLSNTCAAFQPISRLTQALVGCERLANTPLPFAYTLLLHRTAYLFCFLLPFGLADMLGWSAPLAAMLVAYTFFGLDALPMLRDALASGAWFDGPAWDDAGRQPPGLQRTPR